MDIESMSRVSILEGSLHETAQARSMMRHGDISTVGSYATLRATKSST